MGDKSQAVLKFFNVQIHAPLIFLETKEHYALLKTFPAVEQNVMAVFTQTFSQNIFIF